jgi:anti-sigma factor ChrR (cupin superfamily)
MNLNDDFDVRASAHGARMQWVASPMPGVERKMLDRIGAELARATSIVRYAPGSAFSPHVHTGGEEFLVLEGVFQDEHGDYPAGSYVRNPPQTRHTPGSAPGCTILVKLWQFDPDDRTDVRLRAEQHVYAAAPGRPGVTEMRLHEDARERVRLEHWAPGAAVATDLPGGGEFFVLDGAFVEHGETFERQSWLRLPKGSKLEAVAGERGAHVWVKTGHLALPQRAPAPARGSA